MSTASYTYIERPGAAPGAPALFLFHGTGGDEHQFLDLGAELKPGARRIAPRGDVSEGGALRYFRRLAEGRYDMADLARATAKMGGFVRERLAAERPAEAIGLGYSNGANILASVLFESPELFDTAVLWHPLIPFAPRAAAGPCGQAHPDHRRPARSDLPGAGNRRRSPTGSPHRAPASKLFWHEGGHEIRRTNCRPRGLFSARSMFRKSRNAFRFEPATTRSGAPIPMQSEWESSARDAPWA